MAAQRKTETTITEPLLQWYAQHGRHHLPWQKTQDAYHIWLSEIMLQQTQVQTVIPYYLRFLERFPDLRALADAELDEVLHLWTGLGYYARARNLHKASQVIRDEYGGVFPTHFDDVIALPGIGRSTAGAILAFAENQHHAILDGNVRRVLARVYGVEGWYGEAEVAERFWQLAELNTPKEAVSDYTQAIMDFGALQCARAKPNCAECPIQTQCIAHAEQRVKELPHGKPKKDKPVRETVMLIVRNPFGEVLLRQNPPAGIWGGLWCLPQLEPAALKRKPLMLPPYQLKVELEKAPFRHTFSHYHLQITPVICQLDGQSGVAEQNEVWYKRGAELTLGLPAPVKKLLEQEN